MKHKKYLPAMVPFFILGSPQISSARSISRYRLKAAVSAVEDTNNSMKNLDHLRKKVANSEQIDDPFAAFGHSRPAQAEGISTQDEILEFLKENNLLASKTVKQNSVSGALGRKIFASITSTSHCHASNSSGSILSKVASVKSCTSGGNVWHSAANQLPTASNHTVTAIEDNAYTFKEAEFKYSDADSDPLASLKITGLETAGSLEYSGKEVSLNQVIPASSINLLTFTPATDANGTAYDSFTFSVNDGTGDSTSSYTMTIDVTGVNDSPSGSDATLAATEDTDYVFSLSDFGFADHSAESNALAAVKVVSLETAGSLQLSGSDVTLNQSISAADIAAGNLKFIPVSNANGNGYDNFNFQVQDDGGTANSGMDLDPVSKTITIDVSAVADAPTAANNSIVTNEDTDYIFTLADFNFADVDGDALVSVKITSLTASGSLSLSGSAVTLNQLITASDINSGLLTFAPTENEGGANYTSFDFTVNDGTSDSASSYTMAIDVTLQQDAPSISGTPVNTIDEDSLYGFIPTASDPDSSDTLSFSIVNQPSWASFNVSTGALTGTPTNDDVGSTAGIIISVTDGTELASMPSFTLTVTNTNDVPTISGTPTTSVAEDASYNFTPTVSDVDIGDTLTYSIQNMPTWASFNTTTGSLSGTPTNSDVATTTGVVISVTDTAGATSTLASFDLTVENVNDPPLILSTGIATAQVGQSYTMNFIATDDDAGAQLTYSAPTLPAWLVFDTSTGELSGTPSDGDVGSHDVQLQVSDGTETKLLDFSISVAAAKVVETTTNDQDGDGITDTDEASIDTDGDGVNDSLESNIHDTDNDGIPDYYDTDSDNDGFIDADEGILDSDADGIPDRLEHNSVDTDNDGTFDYLDNDSDADGVSDGDEGMGDSDEDGIPDRLESNIIDSDVDGLFDNLDTDSDNDGKLDGDEGSADTDKDGLLNRIESSIIDIDGDGLSSEKDTDSDGDGLSDSDEANLDSDLDGLVDRLESNTLDLDGDGITNHLDTDSDGDGLSESTEGLNDSDKDSIADFLEGNFTDSDNDGVYDYLDTDSDGDGIFDFFERSLDTDGDGIIDSLDTDSDNDGVSDQLEGFIDNDADGLPDYRDTDSDGDGKSDESEGNLNTDGDGYPDRVESSEIDSDEDSVSDELDDDSDGDGIIDGSLTNIVSIGELTTEVTTDVVGTKTSSSTDTNGNTVLTTSISSVNESQEVIAIQINGLNDGSANFNLQVTSNGETYDVSADFAAAGVKTVIGNDLNITSQQSIGDADISVIASPDGNVQHQIISTVNGEEITNSVVLDIPGAATIVDSSGNITSQLNQSTASEPANYTIGISVDGSSTYSVSPIVNDSVGGTQQKDPTTITSNISGSNTELSEDGVVTSVTTSTLADGRVVEITTETLPNGESTTSYLITGIEQSTPSYTVNQATPFDSGSEITISITEGRHEVKTKSIIKKEIVF